MLIEDSDTRRLVRQDHRRAADALDAIALQLGISDAAIAAAALRDPWVGAHAGLTLAAHAAALASLAEAVALLTEQPKRIFFHRLPRPTSGAG